MITKLKTVTAKVLANTLDLPVILVDTAYSGIDNFLASLNFPCVLFFDEYEKCFKAEDERHEGNDHNILTIMDGVFNCEARKVFLLTTNEKTINSCLLSRPSRIRYVKEFTNISMEVINHLMDKFLQDQSIREPLINFVVSLDVVSVDIIKAIIGEINIHGKDSFSYIKEIFNVQISPVHYQLLWCTNRINNGTAMVELTDEMAKIKLKRWLQLHDKWNTRTKEEESEFEGHYENEDTPEEKWVSGLNDYCHERYGDFPAKFENLSVGDFCPMGMIVAINPVERMLTCRQGREVYYVWIPEQTIYSRNAMAYGYGEL